MSVTPLMKQYYEIKAGNPGCILFFRMGDFFELFDEDAKIASRILGLTLTTRNSNTEDAPLLCGFPHHAADRYIPKMVASGYRVAICEQVEDPKLAKGIVKRAVVEIISAGTAMSDSNLNAKESNYLCCFFSLPKNQVAFAFADVTTGYLAVSKASESAFESEVSRRFPKEIVVPENISFSKHLESILLSENVLVTRLKENCFSEKFTADILLNHFKVASLDLLGVESDSGESIAAGACLYYLTEQKKSELSHITHIEYLNLQDYMTLDISTLRNLELVRPLNADDFSSTLCSVLDFSVTAMGGRLLKEWISHPLVSKEKILWRENAIAEMVDSPILLEDLKNALQSILDMERLLGRIGSGRANARDLAGLGKSLVQASKVAESLENVASLSLKNLACKLQEAKGKGEEILSYLLEDLPLTVREGGMIARGASESLDRMNDEIKEKREWISSLEGRERERLKIPTLKVGYNKVFGYYIEVTKLNTDKVPEEYIRKQTTVNAERYITPQMKECESIIASAETNIHAEEYRIFCELRNKVEASRQEFQSIAFAIAEIDVYYSLAKAARKYNYVCPEITEEPGIEIKNGFHPVIVAVNSNIDFVPNDVLLSPDKTRLMLITGPNMAGKSTYLRQVGLITLLAQIGSFVPAEYARIGIVDRIFTRVGASDRLSRGLSTFMVEMVETANILKNATPKSLVLLDEIGRGTSTFDGLSIAWAIVESLHNEESLSSLTLFATHYHELTSLIDMLEHAENFQVSVQENGEKLVFLHKIIEGACDSSYGIHVAEMAGLPSVVVRRARRILHRLESQKMDPSDAKVLEKIKEKPQVDLFSEPNENSKLLSEELARINPNEMTPMQALQKLIELKEAYCS